MEDASLEELLLQQVFHTFSSYSPEYGHVRYVCLETDRTRATTCTCMSASIPSLGAQSFFITRLKHLI